MSRLSDFFSLSDTSSTTTTPTDANAWVLLVGGGGGGGAGFKQICCPAQNFYGCIGFGGGGGGVYTGGFRICPGVSYPVVVGAGGACGCLKDECAGEPGGAGSNGGISRFGNCIVMGGGGAGTICFEYCGSSPTPALRPGAGKFVDNKHGANSGSIMRDYCGPTCGVFQDRNVNNHLNVMGSIDGFRADSTDSAGGGIYILHSGKFAPGNPILNSCIMSRQVQFSVADGYILECNPTNDSWELKSTFFGLKLIPEIPTCPDFVMYCCTPTTIPPGSLPAPCGGDSCLDCYGYCYKKIPAANYQLGVSRNQEACSLGSPCCPGATPNPITYGACNSLLQPHIANTGAGGLNQYCPGHPCYPAVCNNYNCVPSPFHWSATGTDGVVYIVYDCDLGAASSTPGAVDCTPVTGPQGYRSYRYTSSGSFTL